MSSEDGNQEEMIVEDQQTEADEQHQQTEGAVSSKKKGGRKAKQPKERKPKAEKSTKEKSKRLDEIVGVKIPVRKVARRIKHTYNTRLSLSAAVMLAAIAEHICAEVSQAGGNKALQLTKKPKDGKKPSFKRITPRVLNLAVRENPDLAQFLSSFNFSIFGGGVNPDAVDKLDREKKIRKDISEIKLKTREEVKAIREKHQPSSKTGKSKSKDKVKTKPDTKQSRKQKV